MSGLLRRVPTPVQPAGGGPRRSGRAVPGVRRIIALAAAAAPVLALLAVVPAATPAAAATSAVPGPPSGWSTVFSDDFNGSAGSEPSSAWQYDTGPGSSFGTGEIETMTNSPGNVHLDGNGNLDITALDQGGSWTSGRIQTTSAERGRAGRRGTRSHRVDRAAEPG